MFVTMVDNRFRSGAYISTLCAGLGESIMLSLLVSIDEGGLNMWPQSVSHFHCILKALNVMALWS